MFAEMTNAELSEIIKAFYECGDCLTCPCAEVVCVATNGKERRKEFALEVAERLLKN